MLFAVNVHFIFKSFDLHYEPSRALFYRFQQELRTATAASNYDMMVGSFECTVELYNDLHFFSTKKKVLYDLLTNDAVFIINGRHRRLHCIPVQFRIPRPEHNELLSPSLDELFAVIIVRQASDITTLECVLCFK